MLPCGCAVACGRNRCEQYGVVDVVNGTGVAVGQKLQKLQMKVAKVTKVTDESYTRKLQSKVTEQEAFRGP